MEKYDFRPEKRSESDHPKGLKRRKELEKRVEGMTRYEKGMKLWEEEQNLLAKARKDGLEQQLIAYWESIGRPRMKERPTKED